MLEQKKIRNLREIGKLQLLKSNIYFMNLCMMGGFCQDA